VLAELREGGTLLLNSPYGIEESWRRMPGDLRARIIQLRLGSHINTMMQA